jgi:Anti-sigma-K factor rskA
MSDDAELERVEQMLLRTPAPEFVPATAAAAARRAALSEPAHVTRAPRRWRMPAWWRIATPAAALGAAVAVAAVLFVGGNGGGFNTQFSLALSGPHGATAVVDFGHASNGVRPMVVHLHGLPPAGAGHYYEMWFRTAGSENVSAVTFDTAGGRSTFKAVIPAKMTWHDCWVTREAIRGSSKPATVLVT